MTAQTDFNTESFLRYSYGSNDLALASAKACFRKYWGVRKNEVARRRAKSIIVAIRELKERNNQ